MLIKVDVLHNYSIRDRLGYRIICKKHRQSPFRTHRHWESIYLSTPGEKRNVGGGDVLYGINILRMTNKSLDRLSHPNIPNLGHTITSSTDKQIWIGRINAQTHDIAQMIGKLCDFCPRINIPKNTSHVPTGRQDSAIVEKPTTTQISGMRRQLPCHTIGPLAGIQVVY